MSFMNIEFSSHPLLLRPPSPQDKARLASQTNEGWRKEFMTQDEFLAYLRGGGAIAPVFNGGIRKNDHWNFSQLLVLDFDNGTDKPAIAKHPWLAQWRYYCGYTPSHTPAHPRTRVILPLLNNIYSMDQFKELAKVALHMVEDLAPDKSSATPARFYFGFLPNTCDYHHGDLPLSERIIDKVQLLHIPDKTDPKPAPNPIYVQTPAQTDFGRYCERVLEGVLGELRGAREGNRNTTLYHASCQIGERLHLDGFTRMEAENWLMSEALALGLSEVEANKTIQSGLDKGRMNPKDPLPKAPNYAPPDTQRVSTGHFYPRASMTLQLEFVGFDYLKKYFNQGEFGDARLFYHLFKNLVIWDEADRAWYVWQGHYWKQDDYIVRVLVANQLAWQYAHAATELYRTKFSDMGEGEDNQPPREKLIAIYRNHEKRLRSKAMRENILNHAQALMRTDGRAWDANPYLLATPNGVIDLCTGEIANGNPKDLIRTYTETTWKGLHEPAPRFERFIHEIFNGDVSLGHFIHRLLGYAISGLSTEHILPIFYGAEGRNGKDTLLETLGSVLGSVSGSVARDVIMDNKMSATGAASPHLVSLQGKRLVWTSETKEGASLDTNQVKYITGGGRIRCRPLYGAEREFTPTHTILLITNHKPRIPNGGDMALWTRLVLIPFGVRFVDNPNLPNERKKDPHLRELLQAETSGILAWLVRGFSAYLQEGLNPPPSVQAATDDYQHGEDDLTQFFDTSCIVSPNVFARASDLYDAYREFGGSMSSTNFGRKVGKLFTKQKISAGIVYQGVGIREGSMNN